jgi:neurofibromin 1
VCCANKLKGTTTNPRNSYPDEQYTLLKPLEITTSSYMISSILVFLDASPLTLFIGAPDSGAEWITFFEDVVASCMTYLVTDNESIRYLANTVARKIMTDGAVALWRKSQILGTGTFKYNFWKST